VTREQLLRVHGGDYIDRIEAQVPNLTLFGSAYSSARGDAGLCNALDRFLDPVPAGSCPSFTHRPG
jgi:hypothetical protein